MALQYSYKTEKNQELMFGGIRCRVSELELEPEPPGAGVFGCWQILCFGPAPAPASILASKFMQIVMYSIKPILISFWSKKIS